MEIMSKLLLIAACFFGFSTAVKSHSTATKAVFSGALIASLVGAGYFGRKAYRAYEKLQKIRLVVQKNPRSIELKEAQGRATASFIMSLGGTGFSAIAAFFAGKEAMKDDAVTPPVVPTVGAVTHGDVGSGDNDGSIVGTNNTSGPNTIENVACEGNNQPALMPQMPQESVQQGIGNSKDDLLDLDKEFEDLYTTYKKLDPRGCKSDGLAMIRRKYEAVSPHKKVAAELAKACEKVQAELAKIPAFTAERIAQEKADKEAEALRAGKKRLDDEKQALDDLREKLLKSYEEMILTELTEKVTRWMEASSPLPIAAELIQSLRNLDRQCDDYGLSKTGFDSVYNKGHRQLTGVVIKKIQAIQAEAEDALQRFNLLGIAVNIRKTLDTLRAEYDQLCNFDMGAAGDADKVCAKVLLDILSDESSPEYALIKKYQNFIAKAKALRAAYSNSRIQMMPGCGVDVLTPAGEADVEVAVLREQKTLINALQAECKALSTELEPMLLRDKDGSVERDRQKYSGWMVALSHLASRAYHIVNGMEEDAIHRETTMNFKALAA
ncbi:MAG: hypothetical protein QG632_842 [Candidatus Dependentiae bacterium]|nr:hypothetical protein [Candidatus Dependentiae bacterium]